MADGGHVCRFVKSVVTRLDVGLNKTRMALVRFSTNSYIDFYLDTYDTATDVLMAIQDMGYEGGAFAVYS